MSDFAIGTRDWAEAIVKELSTIAALETDEQILNTMKFVAGQLTNFYGEFDSLRKQIINLQLKQEIAQKYRQQITSKNMNDIASIYDTTKDDAQMIALYSSLLNKMIVGYYLINKIRDVFFEPINYAIGFYGNGNEVEYIEGVSIEELLEGAMTLSNRIRITNSNFARLEIDLKEVIESLRQKNKVKQATDDQLYKDIMAYASTHGHTYMSKSGKTHTDDPMKPGYLWEAYRAMKAMNMSVQGDNVQTMYEAARRGNLAYFKGGDVLNEQDKFGTQVALTSMATIKQQLPKIIEALTANNTQEVANKLQKIFLQRLTDKTDDYTRRYVEKDVEHLLSILKVPT